MIVHLFPPQHTDKRTRETVSRCGKAGAGNPTRVQPCEIAIHFEKDGYAGELLHAHHRQQVWKIISR